MNNKFDWNRFCKVVNKDFRNIWHSFGTTMLILAVLPFAVWLFMAVVAGSSVSMPPDIRLMMIEGVAYLAALMAPSRMYRTWNVRNDGIYYAMLPASKAEKYVSALLFSLVICPLLVFLGSMTLDVFLTALPFGHWKEWIWQGEAGFPVTFNMRFFEHLAASEVGSEMFMYYGTLWAVGCWIGYISTVLLFVFTSTLFKRHKVLQTILWLYVIEFVLSIILIPIFIAFAGNVDMMEAIFDYLYQNMDAEQIFNSFFWVGIVLNVLLSALFVWLSWRRLNRMAY